MQGLTIGIAGGSGSGKTTIGRKIMKRVGAGRISFLEMDCYYHDLSHLPLEQRLQNNFDHPASLDIELFAEHIRMLKNGIDVEKPQYDFVTHSRVATTTTVKAHPVIIVEGILLYENPAVRELIDIKAYVDTPADLRFIRRLTRDLEERGRTPQTVVKQYAETVRPMHMTFVEPTRELADIIIPWQDYNEVAIDMVIHRVEGGLTSRIQKENVVSINERAVAASNSIRE